jgi:hypothetical protein
MTRDSLHQFSVGCIKCGAEVPTAAAGRVDLSTLDSAWHFDVHWKGEALDRDKKLDLRAALERAAEAKGYYGVATIESVNGRLRVVHVEMQPPDEGAAPTADEARAFVKSALGDGGAEVA